MMFTEGNVRSIDRDLKTQTRRGVKLPKKWAAAGASLERGCWPDDTSPFGPHLKVTVGDTVQRLFCPYGGPGDTLWVRETSCEVARGRFAYAARDPRPVDGRGKPRKWTPSILMPRERARTILELTKVRVERLHAISTADSISEGIAPLPGQGTQWQPAAGAWWSGDLSVGAKMHARTPEDAYRLLWISIHDVSSWDANPWVWCLSFKVLRGITSRPEET